MALTERSLRIRSLLKARMRQRGISYAALAKDTGVSLATVKRWLTRDDLPVEKLEAILRRLDYSWGELMGAVDSQGDGRAAPTAKQENFIARHPREAMVLILIFVGFSFVGICQELNLSEKELTVILFALDKNNLIAYENNAAIRPLLKLPLRWTEAGVFSQRYFQPVIQEVFEEIVRKKKGFSHSFQPSQPLVSVGETYLTEKSLVRLKADLWELLEKYRDVARVERSVTNLEDRKPVTFLFAIDQFPLWKNVLWVKDTN